MTAIDAIREKGFLKYGQYIPENDLLEILGFKSSDDKGYLWAFLSLYEDLNELGFFCTTRNVEDKGLRIMTAEECLDKCDSLSKKIRKIIKKASKVLLKGDFGNYQCELKQKAEKKLQVFCQMQTSFTSILGRRF